MAAVILQNISITKKIWFMVALSLIGLLAITLSILLQTHTKFIEQRKNAGVEQVQMAVTFLAKMNAKVQAGEMSLAEAQQQGRDMINNTAISDNNYLYVYHVNGGIVAHAILGVNRVTLTEEDVQRIASVTSNLSREQLMEQYGYPTASLTMPQIIARENNGAYTGFAEYAYRRETEFGYRTLTYWGDPYAHPEADHKLLYGELYPDWNWIVLRGIFIEDVEAEFRAWVLSIAGFCSLLLLALAISAYFINRSISQPLSRVMAFMDDIAEGSGDLSHRLVNSGRNELSRLGSGFNTFVSKLEKIISAVLNTNQGVMEKSRSLSEKIERSAKRSSDQLSETEMLASSTTELSASLSDVARGAQQSAESAREANEATAQATQALANTRSTVEGLAKTLVEIQQKAHDMKSHNQKVNSVIEVIRGIAEQTNLLALNAAIEAARAGEQGRGFAVVADEVRNLAQKTQASTMEINAIIEQLQNNTDQVVSAMDAGVGRSHHSVETANDANQLLQTAITAVQAILSRSEEIAHSVEQQSQVTDEIANSSVKIAGDGKLNAEDFSDCLQLNRDVNENLQALRELLGQFKLKQ
jgi:methyl-accepting chemotaxis protein